ncbi:MAG: hypothetical protein RJA47_1048 [Actinomycetota bacterium]
MTRGNWGATDAEIDGPVIGDGICPRARISATRCIDIAGPPEAVFPWIRQMGFGKAGWYSHDWIDNLGRRSATEVRAEWQDVHTGSRVPGGPVAFEAALVEPPRGFVLRTVQSGRFTSRMCFTLAYELRPVATGTRLVTRMRARMDIPGGRILERFVLLPGDGIMLRKQLRTLARRSAE